MAVDLVLYAEDVEGSGWQNPAVDGAGCYGPIWKVLYFIDTSGDYIMSTDYDYINECDSDDTNLSNIRRAEKKTRHDLYALYKCLYHWEFMCAPGITEKESFWDFRKQARLVYRPVSECYACANAMANNSSKTRLYCNKCILIGFAWNPYCLYSEDGVTFGFYSFFMKWTKRYENQQYYAQKMVDAIKEAIKFHEMKRLRRYNG